MIASGSGGFGAETSHRAELLGRLPRDFSLVRCKRDR